MCAHQCEFGYALLTMKRRSPLVSIKRRKEGANRSVEPAETSPPPAQPTPAANPSTGYRISIFPTALEISARLATAEELQTLVRVLQANATIWETVTKEDGAKNLVAQAS
jgi:hypothetical protein